MQPTLRCDLHCGATYTAVRPTLRCDLHCGVTYTAVRPTLRCDLHCGATYTAVGPTLRCDLHCGVTYTAVRPPLRCDVYPGKYSHCCLYISPSYKPTYCMTCLHLHLHMPPSTTSLLYIFNIYLNLCLLFLSLLISPSPHHPPQFIVPHPLSSFLTSNHPFFPPSLSPSLSPSLLLFPFLSFPSSLLYSTAYNTLSNISPYSEHSHLLLAV